MWMNITVLEDRPHVLRDAVNEIRKLGVDTINVVCYTPDKEEDPDFEKEAKSICDEMGVNFIFVENSSFNRVLDELYKDKSLKFLFDMDLLGDLSKHFLQRINVCYAREKRDKEKNDGRIWFYTTGPLSAIEQIDEYFPNRRIPVCYFDPIKEIAYFDYDFISENVLGQE